MYEGFKLELLKMKNSGVEVTVENVESHPFCPHGPTLMFERYTVDGKKSGRKFYACSACRNRTDCKFFHWVDDKFSSEHEEFWKFQRKMAEPPHTHEEYMRRLNKILKIPVSQRRFCHSCSALILPSEEDTHQGHETIKNITDKQLLEPSLLFKTLENNKAEAQYFFSRNTVEFITALLKDIGFHRIVCIGTPKIHEYIVSEEVPGLSSILLDIDCRYMQFFNGQQFCHYNMFNNYFFGGESSKQNFKDFLCKNNGNDIVLVVDPPFGGLIDAISHTLKQITLLWKKCNRKENDQDIPLLWFFPYFNENRILENMPQLEMMDYRVKYLNHKTFSCKKQNKSSPIRIFTSIKPSLFHLPDDAYRYCEACERYVTKENVHCFKCRACTTKDGKTYKHCDLCNRCVKPSYEHCTTCGKCVHANHDCEIVLKPSACFLCKGLGHKKRDCPNKDLGQKRKKKKLK